MNGFFEYDGVIRVLKKGGGHVVDVSYSNDNSGFLFVDTVHGHNREIKLKRKQNMQIKTETKKIKT